MREANMDQKTTTSSSRSANFLPQIIPAAEKKGFKNNSMYAKGACLIVSPPVKPSFAQTIIIIMEPNVIVMKKTSVFFSLSPRKHMASKHTIIGVVLLTSDTTTISMWSTVILFIIVDVAYYNDFITKGTTYSLFISS